MPRDPYPFPRLQNDGDFCGQQGKQVKPENFSNHGGFLCFWNQVAARRFVLKQSRLAIECCYLILREENEKERVDTMGMLTCK